MKSLFTYGPAENVSLSIAELAKLHERFPDALERIDGFSLQKAAHGYKYRSDYYAILSWARKDERKNGKANRNNSTTETADRVVADLLKKIK